ncbi:YbbN family protein [Angustibacter aerolatus]
MTTAAVRRLTPAAVDVATNAPGVTVVMLLSDDPRSRELVPQLRRLAWRRSDLALWAADVDAEPQLAERLGVDRAPAALLFVDGRARGRLTGELREPRVEVFADSVLETVDV